MDYLMIILWGLLTFPKGVSVIGTEKIIHWDIPAHSPVSQLYVPMNITLISLEMLNRSTSQADSLVKDVLGELRFLKSELQNEKELLRRVYRNFQAGSAAGHLTSSHRVKRFDPVSVVIAGAAAVTSIVALGVASAAMAKVNRLDAEMTGLREAAREISTFAKQQSEMNILFKGQMDQLEKDVKDKFDYVFRAMTTLQEQLDTVVGTTRARLLIDRLFGPCIGKLLNCPLTGRYVGGIPELFMIHQLTGINAKATMTKTFNLLSIGLKGVSLTNVEVETAELEIVLNMPVYGPTADIRFSCSIEKVEGNHNICYRHTCDILDHTDNPIGWAQLPNVLNTVKDKFLGIYWWTELDAHPWENDTRTRQWKDATCRPVTRVEAEPCMLMQGWYLCDCDVASCGMKNQPGSVVKGLQLMLGGVQSITVTSRRYGTPAMSVGAGLSISLVIASSPGLEPLERPSLQWDKFDKLTEKQKLTIARADIHLDKSESEETVHIFGQAMMISVIILILIVGIVFYLWRRRQYRLRNDRAVRYRRRRDVV